MCNLPSLYLQASSPFQKEYDDYVAILLEGQGNKSKVLYEQVESMSQRQGANPRILAREQWNVNTMSNKTKLMLEENDRSVRRWPYFKDGGVWGYLFIYLFIFKIDLFYVIWRKQLSLC